MGPRQDEGEPFPVRTSRFSRHHPRPGAWLKQTFDEVALNRLRIEREKNAALRAQVDHLERQAEAREWVAEKSLGKPEKARLDAARKDR